MTLYEFQESIRRDESDPHMAEHDKIWSMFKIAITSGYKFSASEKDNVLCVQFEGQSVPCNDLNHVINYVRYRDRHSDKFSEYGEDRDDGFGVGWDNEFWKGD